MSDLPEPKTVMMNGIKIYYTDVPGGPGLPIIMIHGGGPGVGGIGNYRKNVLPLSKQGVTVDHTTSLMGRALSNF